MTPTQNLLQEIENFCTTHGVSPSRFGREAMGDPNFVLSLKNGRRVLVDTEEKLYQFMENFESGQQP